jgi:hypothetical protein
VPEPGGRPGVVTGVEPVFERPLVSIVSKQVRRSGILRSTVLKGRTDEDLIVVAVDGEPEQVELSGLLVGVSDPSGLA